MLSGGKRVNSRLARAVARFAARKASTRDYELLNAMLEGLNIARDNKALLVARDGIIISVNERASELCGGSQAQLLGKEVATELFVDTTAQMRDSKIQRWETVLRSASEARIPVEVVRQSLGSTLQGVEVYAIRDLRERREAAEERDRQNYALQQHEEELRIQNMRFDTALNNMSQGLAMFDAEHRLVVCNRLYSELYDLTPEQVQPRTTIREYCWGTATRKGFLATSTSRVSHAVGSPSLARRHPGS